VSAPLPAHLYTLQDQIRFLVRVKGMTMEDAKRDIEQTLHGEIPDEVMDWMYVEERFYKWRKINDTND